MTHPNPHRTVTQIRNALSTYEGDYLRPKINQTPPTPQESHQALLALLQATLANLGTTQ
jgi:hypothetical protein